MQHKNHMPLWYIVKVIEVIGIILLFPFYIIYLLAKNQK